MLLLWFDWLHDTIFFTYKLHVFCYNITRVFQFASGPPLNAKYFMGKLWKISVRESCLQHPILCIYTSKLESTKLECHPFVRMCVCTFEACLCIIHVCVCIYGCVCMSENVFLLFIVGIIVVVSRLY